MNDICKLAKLRFLAEAAIAALTEEGADKTVPQDAAVGILRALLERAAPVLKAMQQIELSDQIEAVLAEQALSAIDPALF